MVPPSDKAKKSPTISTNPSSISISRLKGSIKNVEIKGRPPPNAKSGKLLDDDVLHEAIETVISNSLYQQDDKQRLYTAIRATVKGELPLTQAAAQYAIPFSTVHPYVKKLRIDLGLAEADQYGRRSRTQKSKKNNKPNITANANTNASSASPKKFTKAERGKRSLPPGYVPFKQISIPDVWRQFPDKMEEAVWTAVSNCHYDDEEKRHRLCSAVMEVMSGTKTIKASSCANEVPFTTLQTYFHRSRARMEQLMNGEGMEIYSERSENDTPTMVKIDNNLDALIKNNRNEESLFISVPLSGDHNALSLSGPPSSSHSSTTSPKKLKRNEISTIVSRLITQAEEAKALKNDSAISAIFFKQEDGMKSDSPLPLPLLTGSKKRKPQTVQKFEDIDSSLPTTSKPTSYSISGILEKKDIPPKMFSSINAFV